MSKVIRFGISIEKDLIDKFDRIIRERKYTNRSEAFRDLIREELIKKQWKENKEVAGAITLNYDHHHREIVNKIIDVQHDFQELIVSTQHVHLDHNNCLEIIALKGNPNSVIKLADTLKAMKGIKHTALSMSCTGKDIG